MVSTFLAMYKNIQTPQNIDSSTRPVKEYTRPRACEFRQKTIQHQIARIGALVKFSRALCWLYEMTVLLPKPFVHEALQQPLCCVNAIVSARPLMTRLRQKYTPMYNPTKAPLGTNVSIMGRPRRWTTR